MFSKQDILVQLDDVLASPNISGSNVLAEFLKFIVHETLEGRGGELKEYTIGVNALKRDPAFNPQLDSIVRIHAGRLRRALKEYYYEIGANDKIIITVPKGSYQPVFGPRVDAGVGVSEYTPETAVTDQHAYADRHLVANGNERNLWHKIPVAVLPFRHIGLDETLVNFSNGMGEYLSTELTSFTDLRIISHYLGSFAASQSTDIRRLGQALQTRYLLTGTVQLLNPLVRVWVQLHDSSTGEQLWAHTFEQNYSANELGKFQEEVVNRVLGGVTGVNGAISKSETQGSHNEKARVSISYWYTRYTNSFDEKTMMQALHYYETILANDPANSRVLGFMGEILAGETLLPNRKDKSLDRAISCSRMAIKLDPQFQQGYQALAICLLLQRKKAECIQILRQGLALNPKSTDFRGGMGALLIFAGEFEKGAEFVRSAVEFTPNLPWWQIFSLSFYSYVTGNYNEAIALTTKMEVDIIWIPIIKAASYAELGQMDDAKAIFESLQKLFPDVDLSTPSVLNQFFYSDEIVKAISVGLKKISG